MTPLILAAALLAPSPQSRDQATAEAGVRARAFDIDTHGERIAVGYQDGSLRLLAAESGELVRELPGIAPAVPWSLRFAPDGRKLACVDHAGDLRLFDLDSAEPPEAQPALPPNESLPRYDFGLLLSWAPDGERLFAMDSSGGATLFDAAGRAIRRWEAKDPPGDPNAVWSTDSRTLFIGRGTRVLALDAADGTERTEETPPSTLACGAAVVAFALHPDGERLASGHDDGRYFVWDMASPEPTRKRRLEDPVFPSAEDEVAALAWSPTGDRLALSTREGSYVIVEDTESGERLWTSEFLGAHFFEAMPLAFDPRGEGLWFAFECGGGTLYRLGPDMEVAELGVGHVPRFGGELAVTIAKGDVLALSFDGARRWRRVERRMPDGTRGEVLVGEDE